MKRYTAVFLLIFALAVVARADITSYTAKKENGRIRLTSVTAQRDGKTLIFEAEKLIPVRLIHFKADTPRVAVVPSGAPVPAPGKRDSLLGLVLNAGFLNPGGQTADITAAPSLTGPDATPGFAVAFETPVVNLEGDDVVFFELQLGTNSPLAGDPVRVAPVEWREGLHAIIIDAYDIQFEHPKAKDLATFDLLTTTGPPASWEALQTGELTRGGPSSGFKALAVAIDLSELGYGDGEAVSQLFFQNTIPGEPAVDPVCIAGLPAPEAPNVLEAEPRTIEDDPSLLIEQFLASPEADFDEIVFAVRAPGTDHWYANFGYYSAPEREYPPTQRAPGGVKLPAIYKDGGRLCRLSLRTGALIVLLEDLAGAVRDPQVHYSGEKLIFSYRRGGDEYYHLYEINADGSGLKQLTDGPYNDIEPTYLPDGGIMFCSDRCKRYVNCWISPVATLYRCEGDGSGLRMVSTNIEHDNTPWVLPDGRLLYMRWEYVDRSQSHFHHLWTTNPDGTGQMVYYGNQHPGYTMIDAKPIPGTDKTVVSFSPGHGRPEHAGYVTVVDPSLGPDSQKSAVRIGGEPVFRDPYPLSEEYFLVARENEVLVMQEDGYTACLYTLGEADAGRFVHEPRPLRPRKRERVIPPRVDMTKTTGRLFLADIYEGRNMEGVERGEIKELLVLEQLPKPVSFSGGMWPISIGGTFTLARILGTVPVEPDGSAFFEVPAMRSLFFVALDNDGLSVKRMQSFLSVMPGETTGCVGCHEGRLTSAPSGVARLDAMRKLPSSITPPEGIPDVMDYARDIQPILDKHCVGCHNPGKLEGNADLTGDHTPLFSVSYWTMMERGLIADGRNEPYGNRPPRTIGSSASRLMEKIDGSHHDVKVSAHERDVIRLWIESSVHYAGTYAALGSGMFPVEFPIEVMERRCGGCHGSPPPERNPIYKHQYFKFSKAAPAYPLVHTFMDLQLIRARMGYYKFGMGRPPQSLCNLTRPEMSVLLRAPLARDAGGLQRCGETVFTTCEDADYHAILAAIRVASEKQAAEKRFDMPGFRPNDYYIYQMQRYGVLPADLAPDEPVDSYAADQAYWRSFWHE